VNPLTLFPVANAMGGDFMPPMPALPGWNRGIREARRAAERAKRQPIDALAEIQKLDGKRFRHIVTGEIRMVDAAVDDRTGTVGFMAETGKSFEREPRKALRWIRNAVEVTS
jgi:hypothetical protein